MKHALKLSLMLLATASAPVFANGTTEFMLGQASHKLANIDENATSFLVRFNRDQIGNLDYLSYHYLLGYYGGLDEKLDYIYGGAIINETLETSVFTFGVGLKADFQIVDNWSVYGQLGVAGNAASVDFSYRETFGTSSSSGKVDESGVYGSLYYGAGVTYEINSSLSVGVDYLLTNFSLSDTLGKEKYKLSNISAVVGYNF